MARASTRPQPKPPHETKAGERHKTRTAKTRTAPRRVRRRPEGYAAQGTGQCLEGVCP